MKSIRKFCKKCRRATDHLEWSQLLPNESLFERAFFAIGTLGMAEMIRDKVHECQECGRRRVQ